MKKNLQILLFLFLGLNLSAQFGTAHDFEVEDINGNKHNLYEILDSDKLVIVDVSATWCGPCWSMHQSHALEELYAIYGPEGTNQIEIIFYEGDGATTLDDLLGTGGNTLGDWVTGVTYPIINESPISLDLNIYAPLGFPTISLIRPSDREIVADMWNWNIADMITTTDETLASEGITSAEEVALANEVTLAPNPVTNLLQIDTDIQIEKFQIVNNLGQIVRADRFTTSSIDVSYLENGQYFVRLYTLDNKTLVKNFVKM